MTNIVQSNNNNDGRGPSGGVWRTCPWAELRRDPNRGITFERDWHEVPFTTPTTAANWGEGLAGFTSTNGVFVPSTPQVDGVITIGSSSAIDNDAAVITQVNPMVQIASTRGRLWFETRIKFDTIADTKYDAFIGLCEKITPGLVLPITATAGTMADKNFIGFHKPGNSRSGAGSGGGIIRATYKADGQTVQGDAADFTTLTADTWVKLGFVFTGGSSGVLDWYVNGVKTGTSVTSGTAAGSIGHATFPNDVVLGLAMAVVHTATLTNSAMSVDWVRFAQEALVID